MLKKVSTSLLEIAYEERGAAEGAPVILMHGFPDDAQTWKRATEQLAAAGLRTLAIYARGYGATSFHDDSTMRSGEAVAYATDIIEFADALGLDKFTFVGHDWGAVAAYPLAVLHPERLNAMVAVSVGYPNGLPVAAEEPISPEQIRAYWYQWFFNTDKGAQTFGARYEEFCRTLWRTWSPDWDFTTAEFEQTAESWKNPDFLSVVIHSYRFRWGNAAGDARYKPLAAKLQGKPEITVPTIVLHGAEDGASLAASSVGKEPHFTNFYERRLLKGSGHFVPREQPEAVVEAVLNLTNSV